MQSAKLSKIQLNHTPQQVVAALQHLPSLVFFDSSGNIPKRYHSPISIVAANPSQVITGDLKHSATLQELELVLAHTDEQASHHQSLPNGGAMGWIDYDGSCCFGIFHQVLVYQHDTQQWWSSSNLEHQLKFDTSSEEFKIGNFQSNLTEQEYLEKVGQIHQYIAAGDIYQVNLTQRFQADITGGSLYPLYLKLRESAPAPMAAYLKLGDREILSSSPETFLRMNGKHIETRPIKGTRPRFQDPIKDQQSAKQLVSSEKEIAELVMITDLERNDLGQVCEFGSVKVPELTQLETLQHVFHLVSKVEGKITPEVSQLEALSACFPGGSITGAPKKRAMEIIEELETVPRGLYTGAIGYLGFNQASQFNIVIRTLSRENQKLTYHVGAGIVADSKPQHEYTETLQKAKGIRKAIDEIDAV